MSVSLKQDFIWMQRAIELAKRGKYRTSPNPMVGCVVVRGNQLISEGFHQCFGHHHAEINAITKARSKSNKSTLYVTLEPCSTWGKTPPCVQAILEAGITRVVIGAVDPNPLHRSRGVRFLKEKGLRVDVGVLKKEAEALIRPFETFICKKRPFVTLKMAQTLDGKIATRAGKSQWITSAKAREFVRELRAESDAVLVGARTLRKDNPSLTVRPRKKAQPKDKPWRVVIDLDLKLPRSAKVFGGAQATLIVIREDRIAELSRKSISRKKGQTIQLLPVKVKNNQVELGDLLRKLAQLGVMNLLVEGGGELAWSLLEKKYVDQFYWFVAPKFLGGRDSVTSIEGKGVSLLSKAFDLDVRRVSQVGSDWLFEGALRR